MLRAPMFHDVTRDVVTFDWAKCQPKAALLCLPAMAIPLALGFGSGHLREAMMLAAGAFSVGFGSFQQFGKRRQTPMLIAAAGMCVSSWIGTLGGLWPPAIVVLCAAWGTMYSLAWNQGPGASWVALQCVIWLIISSAHPASGLSALTRGGLVLGGGLLQITIVSATWQWTGKVPTPGVATARASEPAVVTLVTPRTLQLWEAARVGVVLAASMAISRGLNLASGYWVPMTAAIVTRPELHQTFQRGVARIVGTLAGAALATLIAFALRPLPVALSVLAVAFAGACYLLVYVNYALFAVCLTSYVVFLLALTGAPEMEVVTHRVVNTLLGGTLAGMGHAASSGLGHYMVLRRPRRARADE